MASIRDAIEESLNEHNALLKYLIWATPVFCALLLYMKDKRMSELFYLLAGIGILNIFAILIKCTNNVMNFRDKLLPTFNPISFYFDSIRTIIAILPAAAINYLIANFLITRVYSMIAVTQVAQAATYVTYGVCGSIIVTVYMLFAKNFSFKDTFDVKAISDSCIDVFIQGLWMLVQVAIIDALLIGGITYLCWCFIGLQNIITYATWCIGVVFNAAIIGNYLGQLNYEALHQAEEKAKKKKEKDELKDLQNSNGPTSPSSF